MNCVKGQRAPVVVAGAVLFVVLILVLYVRLRYSVIPLDRDEGGWAYAGSLILQGIPVYEGFFHFKLPGVFYIYAMIMSLAGPNPAAIKITLLAVNVLTAFFLFFALREKFGFTAACSGTCFFLLYTLSITTEGFTANTEQFSVFFLVLAFFVLRKYPEINRTRGLVFSGILACLSFMCKQPALLFSLFLVSVIVIDGKGLLESFRRVMIFAAGFLIPFSIFFAHLFFTGTFDNFVNMAKYAAYYGTKVPFMRGMLELYINGGKVFMSFAPFIILMLSGIVLAAVTRRMFMIQFVFLAVSFAAVSAGLYYRQHYFIFMAPAIAFVLAYVFQTADKARGKIGILSVSLLAASVIYYASSEYRYLFTMTPKELVKTYYGPNPFQESPQIGRFINDNSGEGDTIAVLGSEPQLFFYSGRKSATGFIYMMDIMNGPMAKEMQMRAVRQIVEAKPEILVLVHVTMSWMLRPDSERGIFYWYEKYRDEYYDKIGIVHIKDPETTLFVFGKEARSFIPDTFNYVEIYKRKKMI